MTVGASITKLANLVHRKVLAGPGVPLVAGLQAAIFSLACFFQMLLVAFFTKLTETKLEVFAVELESRIFESLFQRWMLKAP